LLQTRCTSKQLYLRKGCIDLHVRRKGYHTGEFILRKCERPVPRRKLCLLLAFHRLPVYIQQWFFFNALIAFRIRLSCLCSLFDYASLVLVDKSALFVRSESLREELYSNFSFDIVLSTTTMYSTNLCLLHAL